MRVHKMWYAQHMGLLSKVFPRSRWHKKAATSTYFKTFTDYSPVFTTWRGGVYEQALTRSIIERHAIACSKLKPEVMGSAKPRVQRLFRGQPNPYMTWPQFLARCATILDVDTTCAIVPSLDSSLSVTGLYPLKFESAEVFELDGEAWAHFYLASGDDPVIELSRIVLLTSFQYESDFFGGGNGPMDPTMRLLDVQDQAQELAVRNGSNIRFIGRVNGLMDEEKLKAKRDQFAKDNISSENTSGLLLYDQTIQDLKQVEAERYVIDADELAAIEENAFNYFGMSKKVLQNDFDENQWDAYYESRVEPFAIQLSEGLTKALYTEIEQAHGNRVMFSSNRLEYASNASKRNMIRDMTDRRIMTINEAREVLQLPPVPGGDVFIYRGEYVVMDMQGNVTYTSGGDAGTDGANTQQQFKDFDLGGDDDEYVDNDTRGTLEQDNDE